MSTAKRAKIIGVLLFCSALAGSCSQAAEESETTSAQSPAPAPEPREGMVKIPGGSFLFGSTEEQVDAYLGRSTMNFPGMTEAVRKQFVIPPRPQDLPPFYIQEFEVTNGEYKSFLDATGYRPETRADFLKHWQGGTFPDWAEDFPVVWVSVSDAEAYCRWRQGYLPSEEQWEKASRGASGRAFPWGNTFPTPETSNFGRSRSEPVGNRAGDVSPYQVYDLAGNVAEWTNSQVTLDGQQFFIIRGGSFAQTARETLTGRRRYHNATQPDARFEDVGFRCASN